jgi:hypothetical protein
MPTKFSQFTFGGPAGAGDILVGLRHGTNTQFNAASLPAFPYQTLLVGQPLIPNTGYFLANGVPATYTLPAVCPAGSTIILINIGPSTVTIAQNAGQQIIFGNLITTLGVAGSIQSVTSGDAVTLVCYNTNFGFVVSGGAQGIWNIV